MRSPIAALTAAALASFLFACGVGLSQTRDNPNPSPGSDAGNDAGGCPTDIPLIACVAPCGGPSSAPQCIDGSWQCPVYGGVDCIEVDAGCGDPQPVCPQDCAGQGTQPVCFGGTWSCLGTACPVDGGPPPDDAAPPPDDANAPPPFSCGNLACDPATSYCEIIAGGPVLEDGGAPTAYCYALPQSCTPGAATCGCMGIQGAGCGCVASDGKVVETCEAP